jgi:hypothetical protein
MLRKPVLEQEYVYISDSGDDFRVVKIALDITEMEEIITLKPEQNMSMSEVERALKGFEEDILQKMQMELSGTYPARLEYKGRVFKIAFGENKKVKGLAPL